MTDQPTPISRARSNPWRARLLMVLLGGMLLLAFALRINDPAKSRETARTALVPVPTITPADIPARELREITESLVKTHRWFNSLPFARLQFHVTVTKSDLQFEHDIEEMRKSFPESKVDDTTIPTLSRVWKIDQSITFDDARLAGISQSRALGRQAETWDGSLLTGYVDHANEQEPNYYLKSTVSELTSGLAWFPLIGTSSIWFYNGTQGDRQLDWQQASPRFVGATEFDERECLVFRDTRDHWIVGRDDRKVYGRYSQNDWEQFDRHQQVADGVFWPMASTRKRYGKGGLEWTDRVIVTSLDTINSPDGADFNVELEAGVKVCDLRFEDPVVFTVDPGRTDKELAAIYAEARQRHRRASVSEQRSQELIGKMAPQLGTGTWLNSKPLSMRGLRGKRSVLVGFGHTACAPCGNMLSAFSKMQNSSAEQLILVFSASDSIAAVKEKLHLYKLDCPTFIPGDQSGVGEVFERYGVNGYPTLIAIDTTGKIISHQIGMLSREVDVTANK